MHPSDAGSSSEESDDADTGTTPHIMDDTNTILVAHSSNADEETSANPSSDEATSGDSDQAQEDHDGSHDDDHWIGQYDYDPEGSPVYHDSEDELDIYAETTYVAWDFSTAHMEVSQGLAWRSRPGNQSSRGPGGLTWGSRAYGRKVTVRGEHWLQVGPAEERQYLPFHLGDTRVLWVANAEWYDWWPQGHPEPRISPLDDENSLPFASDDDDPINTSEEPSSPRERSRSPRLGDACRHQ